MPRLAGLDADYFVAAMNAYKDGSRQHGAMQEIVTDLNETDIDNLSAFYATKEPKAWLVSKAREMLVRMVAVLSRSA